jgi:aminoglycoside phosphotransferase (APT) family kinase protein
VPAELAVEAGRALGALHAIDGSVLPASEHVTAGPPWILSVHRPPVARLRTMTGAQVDVVRMIQSQGAAMRRLDALGRSWRREAAAHGDVRWDNLVVAGSAEAPARLALVDWEAAGAGDPDWDLGCALSEHLSAWVSSMPPEPGASPSRLASLAGRPLLSMWPAIAACWEAYRAELGLDPAESRRRLRRAARYAGARLLQTAFESGAGLERPDGAAALHLQVGLNVLARPREAAERLLGLDPAHASLR